MLNKTLAGLAKGLQQGEFSSVELAQAYLERIKNEDSKYN
jgi:aspartyl-tRNA(Asn)/glutamyl-tRNA(Gln) amidotransferase subunit A